MLVGVAWVFLEFLYLFALCFEKFIGFGFIIMLS
jgi:hypothetical protein